MGDEWKEIAGSIGSGLGASVGGALGGGVINAMLGKPDPADEAKDMMDTLYPGTTPYERLSAGGGGAPGASGQGDAARIAQRTAMNVANINANASRDVARIQTGQQEKGRKSLYGEDGNRVTEANINKTIAETMKVDEETATKIYENVSNRLRSGVAVQQIAKEISIDSKWGQIDASTTAKLVRQVQQQMKGTQIPLRKPSKTPTTVGRPINK